MKTITIAIVAVLLVAGAAGGILLLQNDKETPPGDDLDFIKGVVYLDDGNEIKELSGKGNTTEEIVSSALTSDDHTITYDASKRIDKVDGKSAGTDKAWVLWKWSGPLKWKVLSTVTTETDLFDGVCFSVTLSDVSNVGGNVEYSNNIVPEFTVYFFIQFKEDYNANEWTNAVKTESERRTGFWISGKGADLVKAFDDAVYKYMFKGTYTAEQKRSILVMGDGTGTTIYGWIGMFCGLQDVTIPTDNEGIFNYRYWAQYCWNSELEDWTYNQSAFGGFDISVDKYFSLVRHTTNMDDHDSGLTVTPEDCGLA